MDEYTLFINSLETIIKSMDLAITEFWKNYTGMMTSVGRVFGGSAIKRCLAEDVNSLLNEISKSVPLEFERKENVIYVKRCVVKDLIEKGVIGKENTICPFIRGFVSKMFESIGVGVVVENCTIRIRGV
jgi:predicted hydrocarbon binding protein